MTYVIGIDGGGTKTRGVIAGPDGKVLVTAEVGASNYHSMGLDQVTLALRKLLSDLLSPLKADLSQVSSLAFCGAGIDCEDDVKALKGVFKALGYTQNLIIENDALGALVGAHGAKQGGMLIAGTGSIAMAIDAHGNLIRVGGWGHLIGDEGSAYWLAHGGYRYLSKVADGRLQKTELYDKLLTALDLISPEDIIGLLYSPKVTKDRLAAIAPVIVGAYATDDHAKAIVDHAVDSLVELVDTLFIKSKLTKLELKLSGGVLLNNELMRQLLFEKYLNRPEISIGLPERDAAYGALVLALKY